MRYYCLYIIPALLCVAGCSQKKQNDSTDEVMSVKVSEPLVDSVTLVKTYPGELVAKEWADVIGRVDGQLLKQYFKDGQFVSKGQTLYSIEATKYQDAVRQAEASLETARSQYDYYSRQYEAMKKALESDAVSKMDVVQAESNKKQSQAAILNATADLSIARTNLSYCTVKAPISGYITGGDLKVGAYVNQGAVLAKITDNSAFSAEFRIEDAQYEQMLGMKGGLANVAYRKVPVKFNTSLPHDYTADLVFEAPSVDSNTGTLLLKGDVPNNHGELKSGMFVTVSLPYGFEPKAVMVRDASLQTDQLGKYLYVVNDSDKIVYTPVKVGEVYRDSLRIVESGIKPGQRYVTDALMSVRPGMKVKPVR